MDDFGTEVGLKLRSAVKAKLSELGCYVDDELPDYVMVMVANKRSRPQMQEDLHLFLAANTSSFVAWLFPVLEKLEEVTFTMPPAESSANSKKKTKSVTKNSKKKNKKEKNKEKDKKHMSKKSKKKDKEKDRRKKEERKLLKQKKNTKDTEFIRPNVPPLLMNIERESEPSITDIFAGQILKNHGENLAHCREKIKPEGKVILAELKPELIQVERAILASLDPAAIPPPLDPPPNTPLDTLPSPGADAPVEPEAAAPAPAAPAPAAPAPADPAPAASASPSAAPVAAADADATVKPSQPVVETEEGHAASSQDKLLEINEIEGKIHGLRRKLARQLNPLSDDEDFLSIRAGPAELLPELDDDVFQEISTSRLKDLQTAPLVKDVKPVLPLARPEPAKSPDTETPQIELRLPKRPVRERVEICEETKIVPEPKKSSDSKSERKELKRKREPSKEKSRKSKTKKGRSSHTPEREHNSLSRQRRKSSKKSRDESDKHRKKSSRRRNSGSDKKETVLPSKEKSPCRSAPPASVVTVRPRARPAPMPASQLLFRAVADAQKSLANIPPKIEVEPPRRDTRATRHGGPCLVIQVPGALAAPAAIAAPAAPTAHAVTRDRKASSDSGRERSPSPLSAGASPASPAGQAAPLVTRFINMDYVPQLLVDAEPEEEADGDYVQRADIHNAKVARSDGPVFLVTLEGLDTNQFLSKKLQSEGIDGQTLLSRSRANRKRSRSSRYAEPGEPGTPDKRLSETSEDSDTQVFLKAEDKPHEKREIRYDEAKSDKTYSRSPEKKRRARSPIVFDVDKVRGRRARTRSGSADRGSVAAAPAHPSKYDLIPPLSSASAALPERKAACRKFPLCHFGAQCLFAHPPCKFAAACTRRNCMYSHQAPPAAHPAHPAHPSAAHPAPAAVAPATPSPTLSPSPYIEMSSTASHVVPAPNYKSISAAAAAPVVCKFFPNCVYAACHYFHPKPCRFGKSCANRHECNFYHNDAAATKWRSAV